MSATRKNARRASKRCERNIEPDLKLLEEAMKKALPGPAPIDEIIRIQKKIRRKMRKEGWQPKSP